MRIICGAVKATPLPWLPVLCNIPPPIIRRQAAFLNEWRKYLDNQDLPIHRLVLDDLPSSRLVSRNTL